MAKEKTLWITIWRSIFCLVGLLLVATAAVLEHLFHPLDMTPAYLGIKVLDALGLSLFIMGMLTLVLDIEHWKKYFEARLRSIVFSQEYLRVLSAEELLRRQIDMFRIFYHDESLSETGFVRYCLSKIHGYIVTPYREHVKDYLIVEVVGPSQLRIHDHLSYVCRKAGGAIQERVAWQANAEEILRVESLSLEILGPEKEGEEGERLVLIGLKDMEETQDPDGSVTYEYGLREWRQLDGLTVKFDAYYVVDASTFYTWRMIDPSEKVEFAVSYPESLKIQFKPFLLEPQPADLIDEPGFFRIAFNSWIMPRSGFAWKLLPAGLVQKVEVPRLQESQAPGPAPAPEILLNRSPETAPVAGKGML